MKLFVLPESPSPNSRIVLDKEAYHYLVRVRRLAVGHVFRAVDPSGKEGRVLIERIEHDRLIGSWEELAALSYPEPEMHLFPAALKGGKLDDVLRAAVECGISRWCPWIAQNSIVREMKPDIRLRWKTISEQAMMQSGRSAFPEICQPIDLHSMITELGRCGTAIVFHHQNHHSESLHRILDSPHQPIGLVFGPEGGLDESEITAFEKVGARFSWLGHAILRSETAILYGLASVHTILREKQTWKTP